MSGWIGLPPSINLTPSLRHIVLNLTGTWSSVERDLRDLANVVVKSLPGLKSITLRWRPTSLQYSRSNNVNHFVVAGATIPSFRRESMTIEATEPVQTNIVLTRDQKSSGNASEV